LRLEGILVAAKRIRVYVKVSLFAGKISKRF
jgi:hypothetical protein